MLAETEVGAQGEAHEPVGGEVAEHGSASVTCAAERARGNGLDAVEELKGGTGHEENGGGVDDGFVGSVEAGDVAREDQERDTHSGHERGTEEDGGVTGIACTDRIATAESLSYTDGGSGREAERNHVSEGDGVEGDLVAGLSDGTETRDESGDKSENSDFSGDLNGSGKTESDELTDAGEVGRKGSVAEFRFVVSVVPEKVDDKDGSEISAGDAGGDAGTGDAVGVEAQFAEDQDVVAEEVDEVGSDKGEGDGADHVHTLKGAANSEIEKERD